MFAIEYMTHYINKEYDLIQLAYTQESSLYHYRILRRHGEQRTLASAPVYKTLTSFIWHWLVAYLLPFRWRHWLTTDVTRIHTKCFSISVRYNNSIRYISQSTIAPAYFSVTLGRFLIYHCVYLYWSAKSRWQHKHGITYQRWVIQATREQTLYRGGVLSLWYC